MNYLMCEEKNLFLINMQRIYRSSSVENYSLSLKDSFYIDLSISYLHLYPIATCQQEERREKKNFFLFYQIFIIINDV